MASQGPFFPVTVAVASSGVESNNDWLNPNNVKASDNTEAQITAATYDAGDISYRLICHNFGFNVPVGSTIDGIIVYISRRAFAGAARDYRVQLTNTPTNQTTHLGTNQALVSAWPSTEQFQIYGSDVNTWGATLTPAIVNGTTFGVVISVEATAANTDIGIDIVQMVVHYTEPVPTTLDQVGYRFRNDDGTEATATWKAAENTAITQVADEVFRLRFVINNIGEVSAGPQYIWQYRVNGGSWVGGGDFSTYVKRFSSPNIASGTAFAQLTSGSGTYSQGVITETGDLGPIYNYWNGSGGEYTEHEIVLKADSAYASNGDVIDFRLVYNDGTPLDTYTAIPSLTIGTGIPTVSPSLLTEGTLYSPTVAPGSIAATPGLLSDTAIHAPAVQPITNIAIGLLSESTLHAPSALPGSVNVVISLIQESAIYAPVTQPGSVNLTVDLLGGSTLYAPVAAVGSVTVAPSLLADSVLYGFSFGVSQTRNVSVDLLTQSELYAPTAVAGAVVVQAELLTETAVYPFTSTSRFSVGLITESTVYAPTFRSVVGVGLLTDTTLYGPGILGSVSFVTPDPLGTSTVFAPSVRPGQVNVVTTLLSATAIHAPGFFRITYLSPALLGGATLLTPTGITQRTVTSPGLIQDSILYDLVVAPQPVQILVGLLSQSILHEPILNGTVVGLGEVSIGMILLNGSTVSHQVIASSTAHVVSSSAASHGVQDVDVSHRLIGES